MSKAVSNYSIKSLALTGGGAWGIAYSGLLKSLEDNNLRGDIEYISGTSSGSIMAAPIALGISAEQLIKLALNEDGKGLDLTQLFKSGTAGQNSVIRDLEASLNFIEYNGLTNGQYLTDLTTRVVSELSGGKIVTFEDLHNARTVELQQHGKSKLLELYINVTNLNTGYREVCCYETTPKLAIAHAVRMSSSFPGIFMPVQWGDSLYADGGIVYDYPVTQFDYEKFVNPDSTTPYRPIYNQQTLGSFFGQTEFIASLHSGQPATKLYQNLNSHLSIATAISKVVLNSKFVNLSREVCRTVLIDCLGINNYDSTMSLETKTKLIASGEDATNKFIAAKKLEQDKMPWQDMPVEYKPSKNPSSISIEGTNVPSPVTTSTYAGKILEQREKTKNNSHCIMM